jgi:hypothetical protein
MTLPTESIGSIPRPLSSKYHNFWTCCVDRLPNVEAGAWRSPGIA